MGDWNGKVGESNSKGNVLGPYGVRERNEMGEKIIELARTNGCKIVGSYYNKNEKRKWTWVSPNKITKNEIDHMLINDMSIVKNYEVLALSLIHISEPTRPY